MNTYRLNSLRRFANAVNTALLVPIPAEPGATLALALQRMDQGFAAATATRAVVLPEEAVRAQAALPMTEPGDTLPEAAALLGEPESAPVPDTVPDIRGEVDLPAAPETPPAPAASIALRPVPAAIPVTEKAAADLPGSTRNPRPVRAAPNRPASLAQVMATGFFAALPWAARPSPEAAAAEPGQDDAYRQFLARALQDPWDSTPATQFFATLGWGGGRGEGRVAITAAPGASGGSVAPGNLISDGMRQRLVRPMFSFFTQLPWSGGTHA